MEDNRFETVWQLPNHRFLPGKKNANIIYLRKIVVDTETKKPIAFFGNQENLMYCLAPQHDDRFAFTKLRGSDTDNFFGIPAAIIGLRNVANVSFEPEDADGYRCQLSRSMVGEVLLRGLIHECIYNAEWYYDIRIFMDAIAVEQYISLLHDVYRP